LQIAERSGDELLYRGKVGTGFDDKTMKAILAAMKKVPIVKSTQAKGVLVDPKITTWIEPKIIAEVSYSRITPDKMFREPVFLRLRPDLFEE
jgi:ATP-dependent DNA ligase